MGEGNGGVGGWCTIVYTSEKWQFELRFSLGDNADETGDIILILGLADVTRIVCFFPFFFFSRRG